MKRLVYLLVFISYAAWGQTTVNLSPDSTRYDLHVIGAPTVSYCTEYAIVHAKFVSLEVTPPDSMATKYNALVDSLVNNSNDSVWYEYDTYANFAVHDSLAALVDWRDTSRKFLPTVGITFIAHEGFTGNGTTGSIDMEYNPANEGTKYLLQDAHWSVYVRSNVAEDTYTLGYESNAGSRCLFRPRETNHGSVHNPFWDKSRWLLFVSPF